MNMVTKKLLILSKESGVLYFLANSQQPTANSQQPTANSQQPTANSEQPTNVSPHHKHLLRLP